MESKQQIGEFLVTKIRNAMDEGKTLGFLYSITGVPKSTIHRYAQAETKIIPNAETAYAFLTYFLDVDSTLKIMEKNYPLWWDVFGNNIIKDTKTLDLSSISKFTSVHSAIFYQAQTKSGASNNWIKENFGTQIGFHIRDELIEKGILKSIDSTNKLAHSNYTLSKLQTVLDLITAQCERFPLEKVGETAFLWHLWELFPEGTSEKARAIIRNTVKDLETLKKESASSKLPKTELLKLNIFGDWSIEN